MYKRQIPFIGPELSIWIRGDYVVSDATLNRFFAFHVIAIPLVLVGLVAAHLVALHEVGSNNPDAVSYTHLDVYKRQGRLLCRPQPRAAHLAHGPFLVAAGRVRLPEALQPDPGFAPGRPDARPHRRRTGAG